MMIVKAWHGAGTGTGTGTVDSDDDDDFKLKVDRNYYTRGMPMFVPSMRWSSKKC